ncbi:RuBisCO accumulation factor 1 [Lyngbya aestuarii]|uniref:RuBisCO accumulation factor 1 n=1 Tax=Lyngbya aestuarii TaxID=118322 RepID=UPI00403D8865
MTEIPPTNPDDSPQADSGSVNAEELLQLLRRKESNWVKWGLACQQLQKDGYSPQAIFEETGFEPIQQNQVIVASQVHSTLIKAGVSEAVKSRFESTGSDSLYELRILTQPERAAAAEFIVARNLDSEGSREVAKAIKEFSRLSRVPEGFTNHPGDAVAYQYWKVAKQHNDLQERSRLIARGLMFAHSQEARRQIELLLTEAFGGKQHRAPRLPLYRIEAEEALPRLLPVVGQMPLKTNDFQEFSNIKYNGPFEVVEVSSKQQLVAIPGWQVVRKAQDAVAILADSSQLPIQPANKPEDFLLIIDRKSTQWEADTYFAVDSLGQVKIEWFSEAPDTNLLGRIILVLRPKKILDEAASQDVWQIDE